MHKKSFYITTTIPYVNADPHIGFALELVQSDAIARYQRLTGREVFFTTGTDEYGQKIWEASMKEGKTVEAYVDGYAQKYINLSKVLNISLDNFIRTTSPEHIKAAQEFWRLCDEAGDIYKKKYKGSYCVGCESFKTERDLDENGKCLLHPTLDIQTLEEENYFFKLSKYKDKLLKYLAQEKSVIPEWRRKEAMEYVTNAMEDFSISRTKERLAWGIPIPGDASQVMYVWFGAFVNYISSLGWPADPDKFKKFWTDGDTVQTAGKDMVKFQSVMWQGMLMSAGLETTDTIVYHGFITGEGGVRMSKSLGNVINPEEVAREYGADALRYFLLREVSAFEDTPFTMERFKESYNANLANGLGNLTSRITAMATTYNVVKNNFPAYSDALEIYRSDGYNFSTSIEMFDLKKSMDLIWFQIQLLDKQIQLDQAFKEIKKDEIKGKKLIQEYLDRLFIIALLLASFMPNISEKIQQLIKENKKPETPLFPRKD